MKLNPLLRLFGTDTSAPAGDAVTAEAGAEERALDSSDALYRAYVSLAGTAAGRTVNAETALASIAVLACLIVRAETFSSLPAHVFEERDRRRIRREDHDVYRLVADEWNPAVSAGEGWRWKQIQQDRTGNAYVRVVWGRGGHPVELWPLTGAKPEPRTDERFGLVYRYSGDTITPANLYPAREILHFKGTVLSSPYEGRSLVDLAKETIGLDLASEEFFGRFLDNGSHFPGYLQTDSTLEPKDVDALKAQLAGSAGVFSAGELRIFDRGLKYLTNGMSLKDAELTAEQRWLLEQICRIFRVPLPLVQDWTHGTYTNSEQAGLWFAQHTIVPIAVDTERVLRRRLFLPTERNLRVKWNVDGILRGDYKTRSEGYSLLVNCGVLKPNEARGYEDLDPYDGGDEARVPLNTIPAGAAGANLEARAGYTPTPGPWTALAAVLEDVRGRVRIRADQDRTRRPPRSEEETREFARRAFAPVAEAAARLGVWLDVESEISRALEPANEPEEES